MSVSYKCDRCGTPLAAGRLKVKVDKLYRADTCIPCFELFVKGFMRGKAVEAISKPAVRVDVVP